MIVDAALASGLVPDLLIRQGIRRAIRARLREETCATEEEKRKKLEAYVRMLKASPLAVHTEAANEQHYEVPPAFFDTVLGPALKYSCSYWPPGVETLAQAERSALDLTCERARIENGQTVLDLGCGWGSLSLWIAERYPDSRILAVSNSAAQRAWIEEVATTRGLGNLEVRTGDMREFDPGRRFDRVVSIEMFEHMRNYADLMRRIRSWLNDDGALFVHVFAHREYPYLFEDRGPTDWMARHFFTGGQMPSVDLLAQFQEALELRQQWILDGTHYQRTAAAWLANLDADAPRVREIFSEVYGSEAKRFFAYWRIFFMACEEVWGYRGGQEWVVAHYLFEPRVAAAG